MQQPEIFQHPELDGTSFYWQKGPTAILCLHGFTATTVDVRGIAGTFGKYDFTTSGPLLPGHGTTPEDLNTKNWQDWFNTAEQAYLELRKNHRQIFILGESLGGLLALHLAVKYQDVSGLMLLAPALIIPKLWMSKLMSPFRKYIYKPYALKKNSEDKMPWQGYSVVPLKAGGSFFDFQQIVKRELNQVTVPAIIFQGKRDATIDPASSFIVHDKISSSSKELVWLPDSGHVILLDQQYLDTERLCLEFIQQNLDRIFSL